MSIDIELSMSITLLLCDALSALRKADFKSAFLNLQNAGSIIRVNNLTGDILSTYLYTYLQVKTAHVKLKKQFRKMENEFPIRLQVEV